MKNGFIYPTFDFIIRYLRYLSLVELFKFVATKWFAKESAEDKKYAARIAIDIFQIFKWAVVIGLFLNEVTSNFSRYVTYYLISANLYSYFLFHVWGSNHQQTGGKEYIRSRFINSILAILYFLFCYAYLYLYHFNCEITWPEGDADFINSVYFRRKLRLYVFYL